MPDCEVERIKIGDRVIEIRADIDFYGPKDVRGLSPWRFTAYEGFDRRKVAVGHDRAEVIRQAFMAEEASAATDNGCGGCTCCSDLCPGEHCPTDYIGDFVCPCVAG